MLCGPVDEFTTQFSSWTGHNWRSRSKRLSRQHSKTRMTQYEGNFLFFLSFLISVTYLGQQRSRWRERWSWTRRRKSNDPLFNSLKYHNWCTCLWISGFNLIFLFCCNQGAPGVPGIMGHQGERGQSGLIGLPGVKGQPGSPGIQVWW